MRIVFSARVRSWGCWFSLNTAALVVLGRAGPGRDPGQVRATRQVRARERRVPERRTSELLRTGAGCRGTAAWRIPPGTAVRWVTGRPAGLVSDASRSPGRVPAGGLAGRDPVRHAPDPPDGRELAPAPKGWAQSRRRRSLLRRPMRRTAVTAARTGSARFRTGRPATLSRLIASSSS